MGLQNSENVDDFVDLWKIMLYNKLISKETINITGKEEWGEA